MGVLCHSWYTEEPSRSQAMFLIRWFLLPMIKPALDNMREVEVWLEQEVDDINYTVVRPAGLTNNPVTDKNFSVEEDYHVSGGSGNCTSRCCEIHVAVGVRRKVF